MSDERVEHKSELRDFTIKRSFCVEPGCPNEGKEAVQGQCFHVLDAETDRTIRHMERYAEEFLAEIKEGDPTTYVERLEDYFISLAMNSRATLDEVVQKRSDLATARREAEAAKEAHAQSRGLVRDLTTALENRNRDNAALTQQVERLREVAGKWRSWWVNDGRAHSSNPRFEADGDKLNEESRLALAPAPDKEKDQ